MLGAGPAASAPALGVGSATGPGIGQTVAIGCARERELFTATELAATLRPGSGVFECVAELLHGAVVLIRGQGVTAGEDESDGPLEDT